MNLWDFDAIDWDDDEDEDGNLVHCQSHGVDERVVDQVLRGDPVEVNLKVVTAEWVIVGPDVGGTVWILWFDRSYRRGDWLRPVTGREAEPHEIAAWKRGRGGT